MALSETFSTYFQCDRYFLSFREFKFICICEMYCNFFAITKRLTNTYKFELVKWENNNGRTKSGGEGFTKSHAESLYSLIYANR
jgi:hypothetical protein